MKESRTEDEGARDDANGWYLHEVAGLERSVIIGASTHP